MENNPEHYKYMPGYSKEELPANSSEMSENPEESLPDEEVVLIEETLIPPVMTADERTAPRKSDQDSLPESPELTGIMKFLNFIFSPLLVPSYATLLLFLLSILKIVAPGAAPAYTLTVFGATGLIPFIAIFILQRVGMIKSTELVERRERLYPYIIEFFALGGMTLFFLYKGANTWIWTIYCGATAVCLVNFLINFKIRISNHCSALAALTAVLIVINKYGYPQHSLMWWIIGAVLFAGIIGSVAVIVGRHRLSEVLLGYVTGFLGIILFTLIR